MKYAEKTDVSAEKSRAEIETILRRYGATGFAYGWDETSAVLGFKAHNRQIKFVLEMPDPNDRQFWRTPGRNLPRNKQQALAAWEQATRQRWRALTLVIKAKLEAVAEFRPLRRDSLCPSGAAFVSTMPAPSGFCEGAGCERFPVSPDF